MEDMENSNHRIYTTSFASVYPLYVKKAERKGRTKAEVDQIILWLTGYTQKQFESQLKKLTDFQTFFADAPQMNPARSLIKGVICGVRIEDIKETTMREIRYLDKLIDELAKGRVMQKILRMAIKPGSIKISPEVKAYNQDLAAADRKICDLLAVEISRGLPTAEQKVWHGHPVWFLAGNPIVGYDRLKDCVRLMFWSGQSFKAPGLKKTGTFKAAEARYTELAQIDLADLKRWLKDAEDIQWDYKNIVKRKGVLKKVSKT